MKRYLLFSGNHYYPEGGIEDYRGSFDSVDEAVKHFKTLLKIHREWYHIVDSINDDGLIVKEVFDARSE